MTTNNAKNTKTSITEFGLDIISSLSGVPLLSMIKTVEDIRDKLYIKKISYFFESLNSIPQDELTELISKLESNEEERIKMGENILLIIERLDNMDKPKFLGAMFCDYLKNNISKEDFLLLAKSLEAFNLVYIPSLIAFYQNDNNSVKEDAIQHLAVCSLVSMLFGSGGFISAGGCAKNELGTLFLKYIS